MFFPPSPSGLAFLSSNARLLDASSKNRLDRRTLYAGLLLEWGATDSKFSSSTRKFLPPGSSQALQAALSLATQPLWRKSAPRTNGIRLYQDSGETGGSPAKGSTLGMQETIAMALVSEYDDCYFVGYLQNMFFFSLTHTLPPFIFRVTFLVFFDQSLDINISSGSFARLWDANPR